MVDAYVRSGLGGYVGAATEAGAVAMASGFASVTGRIGVATVTHGPGLTNTVTPLVEAQRGRSPIVLIAGDTPRGATHHLQDIDQRAVVASTGAGFEEVAEAADALGALQRAFDRTVTERRPIVVSIPVDLQWDEVSPMVPTPNVGYRRNVIDQTDLERACEVIASARRPVVLAGRGAISARSRSSVLKFARRIGAPVATTLKAKDLFRGEPENLGICGTLSAPATLAALSRADCVVSFGAALTALTTDHGRLLSGASVVWCDIDEARRSELQGLACSLIGDSAEVSDALGELFLRLELAPRRFAAGAAESVAADSAPDSSPERDIDIRTMLDAVDDAVDPDRTLVVDVGRFMRHALRRLRVAHPMNYVHAANFACLGLGMSTAIGAAAARPDHPCLLVCGDGGFMMGGLAELHTAVRERLDLIVVVMNDGTYGAELVQFAARGMDPSLSFMRWPDLAGTARAMGCEAVTVTGPGDVDSFRHAVESGRRPLLVDVRLDPDGIPPLDG